MKQQFLTAPIACLALLACPAQGGQEKEPLSADWSVTVNLPADGDSNLLGKISTVFGIPAELMPKGSKPSITIGGFNDPATPGQDWVVCCTGIENLAQRLGDVREIISESDEDWDAWMPDDATLIVASTRIERSLQFKKRDDALLFLHLCAAHEEKDEPSSRLLSMISELEASIREEGPLLRFEVMADTSASRPFSPEEAALVRDSMLLTYGNFKKRIEDGRGARLKGELESMAGGRVFTGFQALEQGLVDEIGGLGEAIARMAGVCDMDADAIKLLPEPKSMLEGLFDEPEKPEAGDIVRMGASVSPVAEAIQATLHNGKLAALPRPARQAVTDLFERIESCEDGTVQMIGPGIMIPLK